MFPKCIWCGVGLHKLNRTVEHMVPESLKKVMPHRSRRNNTEWACYECNNERGSVQGSVWNSIIGNIRDAYKLSIRWRKKGLFELYDYWKAKEIEVMGVTCFDYMDVSKFNEIRSLTEELPITKYYKPFTWIS